MNMGGKNFPKKQQNQLQVASIVDEGVPSVQGVEQKPTADRHQLCSPTESQSRGEGSLQHQKTKNAKPVSHAEMKAEPVVDKLGVAQ